ncbi:MAG: arylsulfatase [Phycisphaerae bacterium]
MAVPQSLSRREFLHWTGAFAAGGAAVARTAARALAGPPKEKPNIIFILADDLGYGDIGCYGQKRVQTPNIDGLAAEGMKFTDCYAGSTVCAPSRSCLMTGQHCGHTIIRGNGRVPLRPEDVTVAELLKQAGYATALIGKWGLGEEASTGIPTKQGFDYFFGYLNQHHAHNYYPAFLWRNEQKVQLKNVVPGTGKYGRGVASEKVEYSHDLLAAEALKWVEKNKGGPFFLYFALTIPHANNEARNKGMEVPSYEPYAEKDWPDAQKGHAAMITRMDRDIGRLMGLLKGLGIDGKTLVVFSSDNGPHREGGADPNFFDSNGPLKGIKRDLYEGGIRVPGIARWPGRIKAGAVSGHPWAFWDFLPTACEAAGVQPPENIDGVSFLPEMLGGKQAARGFLYWEFHEGGGSSQAVRMGRWKGLRKSPTGPLELYDLTADVGEEKNVAADHADVVRKIETYLAGARTESSHWPLRERRKPPPKRKSPPKQT